MHDCMVTRSSKQLSRFRLVESIIVVCRLFDRGRDESETPSTAGSLPSPYDNVQTPPRDGATSRGHHNGTLSVTVR